MINSPLGLSVINFNTVELDFEENKLFFSLVSYSNLKPLCLVYVIKMNKTE